MKIKVNVYLALTLLLSAAGLCLQSVCLNRYYESELHLYAVGPVPTILYVLTLVAVLFIFTAVFAMRKDRGMPGKNPGVFFFGVLCALFAAAYFVLCMIRGIPMGTTTQETVVTIGMFAFSATFAGYFACIVFSGRSPVAASGLLGIGAMVFCVCAVLRTYFDMSYPITSPVRIFQLLAFLSLLMFITCEVRRLLTPEGSGYGRYVSAALALIFFAATYSLPMLIYSFLNGADLQVIPFCIHTAAACYAIARLFAKISEEDNMQEYTFTYYDTLDAVDWENVPKAMVDKFGWGYAYRPLCYARGVYAADTGLVVKLTAHETEPRATLTEFMDDVCNDSCMEFFFAGDDKSAYANFEFNALGTQHTSAGAPGARRPVDQVTEIPYDKAEIFPDRWELTLILTPKNVRDITGKELERGAVFYGNFYKCGDQCEQIHYGMWSEVRTERPSFHQPQYFGRFVIG